MEVSIVMPCLNEEETIGACVKKAFAAIKDNKLEGEVIVSDNGSNDNSVKIAAQEGARVVLQKEKGYGRAYQLGISKAQGKFVIIGDSDDTYDFRDIMKFIKPLREGYEFVNGSRIKGKIHNGAMPFLHRYFGNPFLSAVLNLFFKSGFSDVYCGMKAFTKDAYNKIEPVCPGMEFALEIVIDSSRLNLKRTEVPIELYPRKGRSKLRTFKDGWRSLRFMLLYCPNYLFLLPGVVVFTFSFILMLLLLRGPVSIFGHTLQLHAMIFFSMLSLLGFQIINLGIFAKSYSVAEGYENSNNFLRRFYEVFNLEKGILIGLALSLIGLIFAFLVLRDWLVHGQLSREKQLLFGFTVFILGVQVIFSSFLISLVGLKKNITVNR